MWLYILMWFIGFIMGGAVVIEIFFRIDRSKIRAELKVNEYFDNYRNKE